MMESRLATPWRNVTRCRRAGRPPHLWLTEEALAGYTRRVRRALPHAGGEERRELAQRLLAGVTLDPERREVNVAVRLPGNTLRCVEAAARIGALYGVVLLQRRYAFTPGKARRRQGLRLLG